MNQFLPISLLNLNLPSLYLLLCVLTCLQYNYFIDEFLISPLNPLKDQYEIRISRLSVNWLPKLNSIESRYGLTNARDNLINVCVQLLTLLKIHHKTI